MSKLLAGRYELIEKIGEGGMAVVYKARCRLLNRYVAIKILRPEFTKDAQFIENFKKESQAAAGLQHPNIVSVYDVGKEGNINFIVMELIDGRPLSDVIAEKAPMDYKQAIEITKQVASALSLAHKNNIIHRDVKPHNIMITRDGTAKLADFGIAKAVSDSTLVSETSKVIGSVHYFSPEQARGAYVDERSDIYSLGIVLYEMLTGRVPFDGDNPVQVALMHINDEILPPSKLVPGIPPALEKLVMKATDKFQSNRYKSADELLEDLDNIEFVTKMVGNSVFAASEVEEFQEMNKQKSAMDVVNVSKVNSSKNKTTSDEDQAKKKKKKIIIGSIIGAIAAVLLIVGGLYAFGVIGGKGDVEVPDLTNKTYEQAEIELTKLKLNIERDEDAPSAEVEKGKIASQDPLAGEMVKEGTTVTVVVSSGKTEGVVPTLVGQMYTSRAEIDEYLSTWNYKLGDVAEEHSDQAKGTIISQNPDRGEQAEEGTTIDIVVSKGPEEKNSIMPNLVGKTYEEAKKLLEDAGLTVAKPEYQESETTEKGKIIWQQYGPDMELKRGTEVKIIISKGPPEVTPDPEPGDSGDGGDGE
ncbi:serine/threonine protein kinase [Clostridiales Family XIII bacterium PM5-7]